MEFYAWNPDREVVEVLGDAPVLRPVRNFGDLLGPSIVKEVLRVNGMERAPAVRDRRLFSVGSVLHFAEDGDVIWGTGINGKAYGRPYWRTSLDIRAVRGPLTAARLRESGLVVPDVYGDPGSLSGLFWPRETMQRADLAQPALVVPNFNDFPQLLTEVATLDPRSPVELCLQSIASSELVIASSLHAIIVAESFGIPAIRLRSRVEPDFKYEDYYRGTGRSSHQCAVSVDEALAVGPSTAAPTLDPEPLLDAFPFDLWVRGGEAVASAPV